MTYYSGDVITISGSFTDTEGAPTDPTSLTLIVKQHTASSGTTYSYDLGEIVRDGPGEFHLSWTAPVVGYRAMYLVQWIPTGAVQRASTPDRLYVDPVLA